MSVRIPDSVGTIAPSGILHAVATEHKYGTMWVKTMCGPNVWFSTNDPAVNAFDYRYRGGVTTRLCKSKGCRAGFKHLEDDAPR